MNIFNRTQTLPEKINQYFVDLVETAERCSHPGAGLVYFSYFSSSSGAVETVIADKRNYQAVNLSWKLSGCKLVLETIKP